MNLSAIDFVGELALIAGALLMVESSGRLCPSRSSDSLPTRPFAAHSRRASAPHCPWANQ